MVKKRVIWLDIVRIIAIYFVVIIHNYAAHTPPTGIEIGFFAFLHTCIPLFVMVSGALLLPKKETYSQFFSKRIKKVLIPWIIWTFIYMAWHYFVDRYHIVTISQLKYFFEVTFLTQLWFLPMIFGLYLLTPFLRLFVQSAKLTDIFYICILWFIFFSFLPYINPSVTFPKIANNGLPMQIILYSGYFLFGYMLNSIKITKNILLASAVCLFIGILWTTIDGFSLIAHHTYALNFDDSYPGIILASTSLFICMKQIIARYEKNIPSNIFNAIISISIATFGVYLVHQLFMWSTESYTTNIHAVLIGLNPLIVGPIMGLVFFILSFCVVLILQKIPLLKHIVP